MARQQRLLSNLSEPPVTQAALAVHEHNPEEEAQAISSAEGHLSLGELEPADRLLSPYAAAPRFVRTLLLLSQLRSTQGLFDEAMDLLMLGERIDPADIKVPYHIAKLLELRGRYQEAIQYRRRVAFATAQPSAEALTSLINTITRAAGGAERPAISELRFAVKRLEEVSNDAGRLGEAGRALYALPRLRNEGARLLERAHPCPDDHHDIEATWQPLESWCGAEQLPLPRLHDAGESGWRPRMGRLRNAVVTPALQWIPIVDDGKGLVSGLAAERLRLQHEVPSSPMLAYAKDRALLRLPKQMAQASGSALLVGGSGNYYHDVVEYIGSLAIAESLGFSKGARLLVNSDLAPHQTQLLQALGYGPERWFTVEADAPLRVDELVVPTRLAKGGQWIDKLLPTWYRRRLVPPRITPAYRRLYVSRARAARRRLVNEEQVRLWLSLRGFETVEPESLSVAEQIALFSEASHIVGPEGAALTNMIFAPVGARVSVFYNRHLSAGSKDLHFEALARACEHTFKIIDLHPVQASSGQRVIDADVVVREEQLAAVLS
jgi:capsular polysaccharide biosynthesis protein